MAVHYLRCFSRSLYSLRVALDMVSVYIEPLCILHYVVIKGLDAYV